MPIAPDRAGALSAMEGGRVSVGVRPQGLIERELGSGVLRGVVRVVEPLGTEMDITAEAGGTTVVARVRAHRGVEAGQAIGFDVDPEMTHYFEPGEFGAALGREVREAVSA